MEKSSLSPSEIAGGITSGEQSRLASHETDLPKIPIQGGNASCSSCMMKGGKKSKKSSRKSHRKSKKSSRKSKSRKNRK